MLVLPEDQNSRTSVLIMAVSIFSHHAVPCRENFQKVLKIELGFIRLAVEKIHNLLLIGIHVTVLYAS
jgi:hypothetical protein